MRGSQLKARYMTAMTIATKDSVKSSQLKPGRDFDWFRGIQLEDRNSHTGQSVQTTISHKSLKL